MALPLFLSGIGGIGGIGGLLGRLGAGAGAGAGGAGAAGLGGLGAGMASVSPSNMLAATNMGGQGGGGIGGLFSGAGGAGGAGAGAGNPMDELGFNWGEEETRKQLTNKKVDKLPPMPNHTQLPPQPIYRDEAMSLGALRNMFPSEKEDTATAPFDMSSQSRIGQLLQGRRY